MTTSTIGGHVGELDRPGRHTLRGGSIFANFHAMAAPAKKRKKDPARRKATPEKAGNLKPRDPFDLIRLLARSQHDPRKAIAELVQNSLDADATQIVITRFKQRGVKALSICDNGSGVLPHMSRQDALAYIATNIGHSYKRDLSVEQRYQLLLQGKYGIGLLGFWSVGRFLEMRTKLGTEPVRVLRLTENSPRYEIHKERKELPLDEARTEIRIIELHDTAARQLFGRRLAEYLGEELRGQLLQRHVDLLIIDRMTRSPAKRQIKVVPPKFKGVAIAELKRVDVPGTHPARLELFYVPSESEENGTVSLAANGTIVLDDIAAVQGDQLDGTIWGSGRFAGIVDFPALEVAPSTRRGFVPNDAATAFFVALAGIEPQLQSVLDRFEQERQRQNDETMFRQLKRIFRGFDKRLPQYEWFDVEDGSQRGAEKSSITQSANAGAAIDAESGEIISSVASTSPAIDLQSHLFAPGALATITLVPAQLSLQQQQTRRVRAIAMDADGRQIGDRAIHFVWNVRVGAGFVKLHQAEMDQHAARDGTDECSGTNVDRIRVAAGNITGQATVVVRAIEEQTAAEAMLPVNIEPWLDGTTLDLGIPEPQPVHAPTENWRSRMHDGRWEFNAGHPDYLSVVREPKRKLRYIASLLAKELVLKRDHRLEANAALELMVEILSWIERRMPKS